MMIHEITEKVGRYKTRKRVGRGEGSGRGKTSTRGHKGARSRAGFKRRPGFEGGQMPLYRRLPKRGFNNARFRVVYAIVNVGQLDKSFSDGDTVNAETIREARLINAKTGPIKILGNGDLTKKLAVEANGFSQSARSKIEAAGGSATKA